MGGWLPSGQCSNDYVFQQNNTAAKHTLGGLCVFHTHRPTHTIMTQPTDTIMFQLKNCGGVWAMGTAIGVHKQMKTEQK